jgi:hypothetical protein
VLEDPRDIGRHFRRIAAALEAEDRRAPNDVHRGVEVEPGLSQLRHDEAAIGVRKNSIDGIDARQPADSEAFAVTEQVDCGQIDT